MTADYIVAPPPLHGTTKNDGGGIFFLSQCFCNDNPLRYETAEVHAHMFLDPQAPAKSSTRMVGGVKTTRWIPLCVRFRVRVRVSMRVGGDAHGGGVGGTRSVHPTRCPRVKVALFVTVRESRCVECPTIERAVAQRLVSLFLSRRSFYAVVRSLTLTSGVREVSVALTSKLNLAPRYRDPKRF